MRVEFEDKQVITKQQVYYAYDGTRFEDYNACVEYEVKHTSPCIIAADEIPHAIVCRDYIDLYACESDLILVFFPKTFNDLLIIESWTKYAQIEFDISKVPVGEPLLFGVGDYVHSKEYDDESLRGIDEVYGYAGTVKDFKISYCNAIDKMVEAARKNAKVVRS